MSTTRTGRCVRTRFDKRILCAGTLRDWFEVVGRSQLGSRSPDDLVATEQFTVVASFPGALEKVRNTPRFDGITISGERTHFAYMAFDQDIYELDRGSLWLRKTGGSRLRYFKMEAISIYDEYDMWLEMELHETGFADLKAAEA